MGHEKKQFKVDTSDLQCVQFVLSDAYPGSLTKCHLIHFVTFYRIHFKSNKEALLSTVLSPKSFITFLFMDRNEKRNAHLNFAQTVYQVMLLGNLNQKGMGN